MNINDGPLKNCFVSTVFMVNIFIFGQCSKHYTANHLWRFIDIINEKRPPSQCMNDIANYGGNKNCESEINKRYNDGNISNQNVMLCSETFFLVLCNTFQACSVCSPYHIKAMERWRDQTFYGMSNSLTCMEWFYNSSEIVLKSCNRSQDLFDYQPSYTGLGILVILILLALETICLWAFNIKSPDVIDLRCSPSSFSTIKLKDRSGKTIELASKYSALKAVKATMKSKTDSETKITTSNTTNNGDESKRRLMNKLKVMKFCKGLSYKSTRNSIGSKNTNNTKINNI